MNLVRAHFQIIDIFGLAIFLVADIGKIFHRGIKTAFELIHFRDIDLERILWTIYCLNMDILF